MEDMTLTLEKGCLTPPPCMLLLPPLRLGFAATFFAASSFAPKEAAKEEAAPERKQAKEEAPKGSSKALRMLCMALKKKSTGGLL